MSALGQTQTCAVQNRLSALPPNATLNATYGNVRLGPIADMTFSVTRSETSVSFPYAAHHRWARISFCTVSGLSPTFATAASILSLEVPKYLHQCRVSSLLDISTRFRTALVREVIRML